MTDQIIRHVELRWNPQIVDSKWQQRWQDDGIYHVNLEDQGSKWYELTMYPYPSGDAHIGHWYAMAPSDAHARFRRMQGKNVLHPIGFDAFGLPAENAAIRRGIHPHTWTMANIDRMRTQLKSMGTIYDWDKEIICCLPEYYKWNQWLFLQLYKKGLAYRSHAPAVWCPSCQTVLANEQVIDGKGWRSGAVVERKKLHQWFFDITKFSEELLKELNTLSNYDLILVNNIKSYTCCTEHYLDYFNWILNSVKPNNGEILTHTAGFYYIKPIDIEEINQIANKHGYTAFGETGVIVIKPTGNRKL